MKVKTIAEGGFKETEIGLIPNDWDLVNLGNKEYFEVLNSGIDKFENSKGYLSTSSIQWNKIIDVECDITYNDRPLRANMQPRLDTVWFAKMKNTVKVYDFTKENQIEVEKYILSTGFTGLLCNRSITYPKYLGKIFLSPWFNQIKDNLAHGSTQKAVNNQDIKKILIPLPSLLEQQRIAFVLSRIQQAIEQQDKIIETTRELKKSLMNKLFTEGLHSEEQKETEIGLMPKSWDAISVQDCCEVVTGGTPRTEVREYYKEGSIRWMKSGDINTKPIYEVKNRITQLGLENSNARLMPEGTVVIALSGRGKTRGTTSVLKVDCTCSQSVAGMIPNLEKIDSFYLHYYMAYNYDKVRNITGDKDRSGLNLGLVRQIKIAKPKSTVEQKEIADAILSIDKKIWKAESKKQTFQALFGTMLNQLMNGKVRVKDFNFEVD